MQKKIPSILYILLLSSLLGCSFSIKNEPGVSLELAEFRKEVLTDINYELSLSIPTSKQEAISGKLTITFTLSENKTDLPLDFRESSDKLFSLIVNSNESEITFEKEHILLPQNLLKQGENEVTITFEAGETSLNRNEEYLYTLFVPDRARTAFPLFDQPNLKATYTLTLETSSDWNTISNAPLLSKTEQEKRITWKFTESDLISSYLFSFVAGKFEAVTKTVDGRNMTMLHRESDLEKVNRNIEDIFNLHAASIAWLEDYTGINYPFQKFDFALIPSFQYGGMEHVGAIQYRAGSLFLDEAPSESQLLSRASLIAHETAHMWFGDIVTMDWFNDVWTKEVFANFMAAKIVNPSFPEINHDLNFLVRHYPSAYGVDRTKGANPIRQELPNLNEAGTMYGAIIYNKAPIMMRQLELLIGEDVFREGLQEYLSTFAFGNATWPDLISILDKKTETDLKIWSEVWVNTPGRPHIKIQDGDYSALEIIQSDPQNKNRVWSQSFTIKTFFENDDYAYSILSDKRKVNIKIDGFPYYELANSNGFGYGLFSTNINHMELWDDLGDVEKGSLLINIYENLLEGNINPTEYLYDLTSIIQSEENQLLLNLALGHLRFIYWDFLPHEERLSKVQNLEEIVWKTLEAQKESSRKKTFFNTFENIALTENGIDKLYSIWNKELKVDGLILSENDYIGLANTLAIKKPGIAEEVIAKQSSDIKNVDRKRRFEFLIPSLSNNEATRDAFFESLSKEENRQTESWVLAGLRNLHHPLRTASSEKYILASLELLEVIQQTGDIFFPGRWMDETLNNHHSEFAIETVAQFLNDRPDYNYQLKLKILQAADMMERSSKILNLNN